MLAPLMVILARITAQHTRGAHLHILQRDEGEKEGEIFRDIHGSHG